MLGSPFSAKAPTARLRFATVTPSPSSISRVSAAANVRIASPAAISVHTNSASRLASGATERNSIGSTAATLRFAVPAGPVTGTCLMLAVAVAATPRVPLISATASGRSAPG